MSIGRPLESPGTPSSNPLDVFRSFPNPEQVKENRKTTPREAPAYNPLTVSPGRSAEFVRLKQEDSVMSTAKSTSSTTSSRSSSPAGTASGRDAPFESKGLKQLESFRRKMISPPLINTAASVQSSNVSMCGICFHELTKGFPIAVLGSCSHIFCFKCVVIWNECANTCPLCRRTFESFSKAPYDESYSQKMLESFNATGERTPHHAEEILLAQLANNSRNINAALEYAEFLGNSGRFDEMEVQFQSALSIGGSAQEFNEIRARVLHSRGRIHLHNQNYTMAIEIFQEALKLTPHYASAHYHLGSAYIAHGNFKAGEDEFQKCLNSNMNEEPDPKNHDEALMYAHYGLGISWEDSGRFEEALVHLRAAVLRPLADATTSCAMQVSLAGCMRRLGHFEEMEDVLRRGVQLDPRCKSARELLASHLADSGKFVDAQEQFVLLVAASDNDKFRFMMQLAVITYVLGRDVTGKNLFSKAIGLECSSDALPQFIASSYTDLDRIRSEIEDSGLRGFALQRLHFARNWLRFVIGWVLHQQSKFGQAAELFHEVVSAGKNSHDDVREAAGRLLLMCTAASAFC